MTAADVFEQTGDAYLRLIHPNRSGDAYRQEIAPAIALAPDVPDGVVASMITGASWRERLLGLCLAMARRPAGFVEPMVHSLRVPKGIALVPACAALAVLARRGMFSMPPSFSLSFDRKVFDGELGWATDKAMHFAGLRADDPPGRGPNYGQIFDDHVQVYCWILASQTATG